MPNVNSKSQYAKNQVGGAVDHTINNFYKIDRRQNI